MAVLTFPTTAIARVEWRLVTRTQTFISPLTGSGQTLELPGARWAADIQFIPMLTQAQKKELAAFLVSLRGMAGRFYLGEPGNTLEGSGAGLPVFDSSVGYTPSEIGVSGLTPSATGVFNAGDMIGLDTDELKMVIEDVDADSSGEALVKVEPPCRNQPTNLSTIVTTAPKCIMQLVDDEQARWALSPGTVYTSSISCIEAFTQ